MKESLGTTSQRSDILAVILSFSAGIIQLLLFVTSTLGQVANFGNLFVYPNFVPFVILLSMIVALSLVGVISYHKKNKSFVSTRSTFKPFIKIRNWFFEKESVNNPLSMQKSKNFLVIAMIVLVIFTLLFVASTLAYLSKESFYFGINKNMAGFYQMVSFMSLWILSTVILFVWITNEIEKSRQYKPHEFIPNFVRTLQNQGYVNIVIKDDIQLNDGNHLLRVKIQDNSHFFVSQFDGNRIIREISKEEFNNFFNPPVNNQK